MCTPRDNPFRVDRVSALPFVGTEVIALTTRFVSLGTAAIVGPHGAGKSTLMRSIGVALCDLGIPTLGVIVPASATGDERAAALAAVGSAGRETVVLLDGYEQLTWPERRRARRCRRLLITAHRHTRLPTLTTLRPTLATLNAVLAELGIEPSARSAALFATNRGDIRETLMSLYNVWATDGEKSPIFPPTRPAESIR